MMIYGENELKVLERHNATDSFILIDLQKDPDQLKTIADLLQYDSLRMY